MQTRKKSASKVEVGQKRQNTTVVESEQPPKQQKKEMPLAEKTRASKPDFAPLYKKHKEILENMGIDTEKMGALRRLLHTHPEGGFKEFRTQIQVRQTLKEFGIEDKYIKDCAGTGLVVDIFGTSDQESTEGVTSVALRADMDGLPIPENNPHLSYKTTTDHAHMCGHDGHMATILTTAQILQKNRDKIPKNKFIRLLFQPAEEGPGGAKPMIDDGCLENIDEVYGYHNIPNFDEGDIRVCEGPFFAAVSLVKL